MQNAQLLERFIQSFAKLDDMVEFDGVPPELEAGFDDSPYATPLWQPTAIHTDPEALEVIYQTLPGRFPPLYEQLILSYRWLEVYLGHNLRLLANRPGPGLDGLLQQVTNDRILKNVLFPLGLIPFAHAGSSYDPICFDTRNRREDGDCPIVRCEHESILCNDRLGETWLFADSFRELIWNVIIAAEER